MIRWRVCNVIERFARHRDYMLPANFQRVRGLDAEWKFLRSPTEHCLPNLAPLWANGNFGADSPNIVAGCIYKRDVNVAVRFQTASSPL